VPTVLNRAHADRARAHSPLSPFLARSQAWASASPAACWAAASGDFAMAARHSGALGRGERQCPEGPCAEPPRWRHGRRGEGGRRNGARRHDGCRVAGWLRPVARRSSRRERWARKNVCRSGTVFRARRSQGVCGRPPSTCARSVGTFGGSRCASIHARPATQTCCRDAIFARAELGCTFEL
jgi:hypothetical protein